jgi:hypothetical protein
MTAPGGTWGVRGDRTWFLPASGGDNTHHSPGKKEGTGCSLPQGKRQLFVGSLRAAAETAVLADVVFSPGLNNRSSAGKGWSYHF